MLYVKLIIVIEIFRYFERECVEYGRAEQRASGGFKSPQVAGKLWAYIGIKSIHLGMLLLLFMIIVPRQNDPVQPLMFELGANERTSKQASERMSILFGPVYWMPSPKWDDTLWQVHHKIVTQLIDGGVIEEVSLVIIQGGTFVVNYFHLRVSQQRRQLYTFSLLLLIQWLHKGLYFVKKFHYRV